MKILILRIILRKLQNSKKNSKNKTILRIRILVNTSPECCSNEKFSSTRPLIFVLFPDMVLWQVYECYQKSIVHLWILKQKKLLGWQCMSYRFVEDLLKHQCQCEIWDGQFWPSLAPRDTENERSATFLINMLQWICVIREFTKSVKCLVNLRIP